jgi:hypothetical protein
MYHDSLEVLPTHLLERRKLSVTSIVDQHIEPPEGVHRQLHGCLCCGLIAHFQGNGLQPLAILRHQRCRFFRSTRSSYNAVACGEPAAAMSRPSVSASSNQPDLRHYEHPPLSLASSIVSAHSFL